MDFPSANFPLFWNEHDSRAFLNKGFHPMSDRHRRPGTERSVYLDFGRLGGFHPGLRAAQLDCTTPFPYCSKQPCVPVLHEQTAAPTRDICSNSADIMRRIEEAKGVCKKVGFNFYGRSSRVKNKSLNQRKKEVQKHMDVCNDPDAVKDNPELFTRSLSYLPDFFVQHLKEDIDIYDQDYVNGNLMFNANGIFCGDGALTSLKFDDRSFLLYPHGDSFTSVRLSELSPEQSSPSDRRLRESCSLSVPSTVYECCAQETTDSPHVLIRERDRASLLKLTSSSDGNPLLSISETYPSSSSLRSIAFNPYRSSEFLETTSDGNLYVYDVEHRKAIFNHLFNPYVASIDPYQQWSAAKVTAHPRAVVVASNSQILSLDLRSSEETRPLLELTARYFHNSERFRGIATCPSNPHYTCVSSNFNILVIDHRMPGLPCFHKPTPALGCPTLLKWCSLSNQEEEILLSGCQLTCDVSATVLSAGGSQSGSSPLRALCSSALIGRPGDYLRFRDDFLIDVENFTSPLQKRYDFCSLTGLAYVPSDQGFTVFQLTGYGDIFTQSFVARNQMPVDADIANSADTYLSEKSRSRLKSPDACYLQSDLSVIPSSSESVAAQASVGNKISLEFSFRRLKNDLESPQIQCFCGSFRSKDTAHCSECHLSSTADAFEFLSVSPAKDVPSPGFLKNPDVEDLHMTAKDISSRLLCKIWLSMEDLLSDVTAREAEFNANLKQKELEKEIENEAELEAEEVHENLKEDDFETKVL